MQDGVGPARRVGRVAPGGAESHPFVETRGLRVLLVDVDPPHAAVPCDVVHELPAESLAPRPGGDEQHFEHIAGDACEGGEPAELVCPAVASGFARWACRGRSPVPVRPVRPVCPARPAGPVCPVVGVPYDIQVYGRKCFVANHLPEEGDVLLAEEIVRRPHGGLPEGGQCVQFCGRRLREVFDHAAVRVIIRLRVVSAA